ncbi:MAG: hypothetical protein J7578_19865, partial [Chitinophagaceae bacterium]|nr:hypothetical protein [Chitinophagaceae bacterium]
EQATRRDEGRSDDIHVKRNCRKTIKEAAAMSPFHLLLLSLMACSILLVLRSSLAFCNEITAQIAAGIQPINVIWSSRQSIPVSILPLRMKESQGSNIAISVMAGGFH